MSTVEPGSSSLTPRLPGLTATGASVDAETSAARPEAGGSPGRRPAVVETGVEAPARDEDPRAPTSARSDRDAVRLARAALTRLVEPGDETALAVIDVLGPEHALAVLAGRCRPTREEEAALAEVSGSGDAWRRRFAAGLRRWGPRAAELDPARDVLALHRLGGGLLIPEDPAWPACLDDLGHRRPVALWTRGAGVLPEHARTLAVVGSREATAYGRAVTGSLVGPLAAEEVTILSGGAYGIDGQAHRVALETGRGEPPTVAVLAGGLDRFYPAGHEDLLRAVMDRGLLLSEMPPGASPTRHRFLFRNRLIAALAAGVLVVEARWRSGAQNTASHALGLGRELGAVPGPVTSPSSAGCHRLLVETPARLVTDPDAVRGLLRPGDVPGAGGPAAGPGRQLAGASAAAGRRGSAPGSGGASAPGAAGARGGDVRPEDALSEQELLVFDALPLRAHAALDRLAVAAGMPVPTLLSVLQRLARAGLAEERDRRWRRGPRAGG